MEMKRSRSPVPVHVSVEFLEPEASVAVFVLAAGCGSYGLTYGKTATVSIRQYIEYKCRCEQTNVLDDTARSEDLI